MSTLNKKQVEEVFGLMKHADSVNPLQAELSTKASPGDAFRAAAKTRAYLKKKGLDLTDEQQPKTNRALKHFTALLKTVRARS